MKKIRRNQKWNGLTGINIDAPSSFFFLFSGWNPKYFMILDCMNQVLSKIKCLFMSNESNWKHVSTNVIFCFWVMQHFKLDWISMFRLPESTHDDFHYVHEGKWLEYML